MKKIAFIGTGVMGSSMAGHLIKRNYDVSIYSRTKEKADTLIAQGGRWCPGIRECVREAGVVITMVGFPRDVEDVYFSPQGIINSVRPGTYLIDMTTTSPALSLKIYEEALKNACHALDAPVSGGDIGARNGTLSIMVGGEKSDFDACTDIFSAMGSHVIYEGEPGMGQHTKMANQIAVAGTIAGTCESIIYAEKTGLSVSLMLDSITQGAAASWQLTHMGERIITGDMDPGFFIKHCVKDMKIAVEEAHKREFSLPVLEKVLELYTLLEARGLGELGTQALIQFYRKGLLSP